MNKTLVLTALSGILSVATLSAGWTTFALPDRATFDNTAMTHLSDGRLVYAHAGSVSQQSTFGSSTLSPYLNSPGGGYSYVTSNGFLGVATSPAPDSVFNFTAGDTSSIFAPQATLRQNYGAVVYDGSSVLMVGKNDSGGESEVGHLDNTGAYQTLVNNVSTSSGGITLDGSGNLYVVDNDDSNIYRFTAGQVATSLSGTTLSILDGQLITNLGVSGSLAVDSLGRLYAAGWQLNGIQVFDMVNSVTSSLIPLDDNANYVVSAFSNGSDDYVGWLNASGYGNGDSVVYGYDLDGNIAVPEPSAYALLAGLLSCAAVVARRRK